MVSRAENSASHPVRVQYFALLREQTGRSDEALDTCARTPRELYEELRTRHPFTLGPDTLRVAVNSEFGAWNSRCVPATRWCSFRRSRVADGPGSMERFRFSDVPLEPATLARSLADPACGSYAAFEGWVRDHNEGQAVAHLEYEAYVDLAVRDGERIVTEAIRRFGVARALCVHRTGRLGIGDLPSGSA